MQSFLRTLVSRYRFVAVVIGLALVLAASAYASTTQTRVNRDIGTGVVFVVAGIFIFFKGFKDLQYKRAVENAFTSKVRSMPMGPVELSGNAVQRFPLISPFSSTPCVYYRVRIDELRRTGKNKSWVTIYQDSSENLEFGLRDETGEALICPKGARIMIDNDRVWDGSTASAWPASGERFLTGGSFLGLHNRTRFVESYIAPNDMVYVLGTAAPLRQFRPNDYKDQVMEKIRLVKSDAKAMQAADLNKDGVVSAEEWEAVRLRVTREVENDLNCPAVGAEKDQLFLISDKSEKDVLAQLAWKTTAGVFGGPVISAVALFWVLNMVLKK